MYSVSEQYKDAIRKSNPSYLTGTITFTNGTQRALSVADIALGGASITMQAVTQDVLEFGAAVLGQLDISIRTDRNESRYKYYGAVITLDYNIEVADSIETIPLGVWTIAEAERDNSVLVMSAYDNLIKFDKDLGITYIGTPFELMSALAKDCGCVLAEDEDYYLSLPNGNQSISIMPGSACNTYRQAASIVGQMCGAFVQADRFGKISMRQFSTTETLSLDKSYRYSSSIADYVCTYKDVIVSGLKGTYTSMIETLESGLTMYIDDAPAWDDGPEDGLQLRADNLMAYLSTVRYTPCELVVISDPSIDCGDYITLPTDNGTVNTIVTSYTWNYHGQMEIQSVGKNPYLISSTSKQRTLRDLEMTGGGTGSASQLYVFRNIKAFKCTDKMQPLAQLTFVSSRDTFALFSATVEVTVEVDDITETTSFTVLDSEGNETVYEIPYKREGYANLLIQYYYNGVPLIEPYTAKLGKGSHVISLHYPFSNIEVDSINRFAVYMSSEGGTIRVAKEMFIGTVSGQGLAGTPKWDGTITVDETIEPIKFIVDRFKVGNMTGNVAVTKQTPEKIVVDERLNTTFAGGIEYKPAPMIDVFNTEIIIMPVTEVQDTLHSVKFDMLFNVSHTVYIELDASQTPYVKEDSGVLKLNDTYVYEGCEAEIDEGKCLAVQIKTEDKQAIEEIIIESVVIE